MQMSWLAFIIGVLVMAIGILGVVAPSLVLDASRFAQTPVGLYSVAAIRVVFGLVLIQVAATSRTPKVLRLIGAFILLAGIVTPFLGVDRARAMADWWFAQGITFMRSWAALAVIFGLFIIYAVKPRRHARL
jgi:hypothetical protein